jgi:DNA (cytosine-5)-methyltransferase 1
MQVHRDKHDESPRPKILSLFSGIGGLDLGFTASGFEIVGMVEWNHDACETMRANFGPTANIVEADINDVQPESLYAGSVDFFIGGPPCQTFSAIGRRAGGAPGRLDDRGDLFTQYCRLLKHYKPKGFLFENVRGILSSNKGQDWLVIREAFEELGYRLSYRVMDAAGFGVAQHRERVILVGLRDDQSFHFPRPVCGPDSTAKLPYLSAANALKDIQHEEQIEDLFNAGGKYDHLLAEVPPGGNYLHYTSEMGHAEPKFAWRSKFSDFLHKASPSTPVKTIVASMGRYSGPFHWESRRMSIGELKRLQGFPDDFTLSGGRTSKVRQIGNSVVPPFARYLALAVAKQVFNQDIEVELIAEDVTLSFDSRKGTKAGLTRQKRLKIIDDDVNLLFTDTDDNDSSLKTQANHTMVLKFPVQALSTSQSSGLEQYRVEESITDGAARIRAFGSEEGRHLSSGNLEITFSRNAIPGISSLTIELELANSRHTSSLWDLAHDFVSRHSSYPSLHELYGHFTEPNPRFAVKKFTLTKSDSPLTDLLTWMATEPICDKVWPLTKLNAFGLDFAEDRALAELLRSNRIDYRSNQTNARIPVGHFRICYPYTIPLDRKSFIRVA